ncbi:hypothetical protein HDV00_005594 [Rhizophlyctis rosea]|nr:hypothetical protein HDV00_005594 [Rhizophlyctis rosea]
MVLMKGEHSAWFDRERPRQPIEYAVVSHIWNASNPQSVRGLEIPVLLSDNIEKIAWVSELAMDKAGPPVWLDVYSGEFDANGHPFKSATNPSKSRTDPPRPHDYILQMCNTALKEASWTYTLINHDHFRAIVRIADLLKQTNSNFQKSGTRQSVAYTFKEVSKAVEKVTTSEYFTRVWVKQDRFWARDPIFICEQHPRGCPEGGSYAFQGQKGVAGHDLLQFIEELETSAGKEVGAVLSTKVLHVLCPRLLWERKLGVVDWEAYYSCLTTLVDTTNCSAMRVRDAFYGIAGLAFPTVNLVNLIYHHDDLNWVLTLCKLSNELVQWYPDGKLPSNEFRWEVWRHMTLAPRVQKDGSLGPMIPLLDPPQGAHCFRESFIVGLPSFQSAYCTISHVWGKTKVISPCPCHPTVQIESEKKLSTITELAAGLTSEGLGIWFDVASIDQTDADDQSMQVNYMAIVYGNAKATYIVVDHQAVMFMKEFVDTVEEVLASHGRWVGGLQRLAGSRDRPFDLGDYDDRVWTLQEQFLSRNPIYLCLCAVCSEDRKGSMVAGSLVHSAAMRGKGLVNGFPDLAELFEEALLVAPRLTWDSEGNGVGSPLYYKMLDGLVNGRQRHCSRECDYILGCYKLVFPNLNVPSSLVRKPKQLQDFVARAAASSGCLLVPLAEVRERYAKPSWNFWSLIRFSSRARTVTEPHYEVPDSSDSLLPGLGRSIEKFGSWRKSLRR